MAEKNIKTRIIHKHDTEENWNKATNFIPKQGEIIVYDIDSSHSYERIKVGDGTTNVNSLPYMGEITVDAELSATSENPVQNKTVKAALDKKINKPTNISEGLFGFNSVGSGIIREITFSGNAVEIDTENISNNKALKEYVASKTVNYLSKPTSNGVVGYMSGIGSLTYTLNTTMPDSPTNESVPTTKLLKDYVEDNTSNPLQLSDANLQKSGLISQSYTPPGSTPGTVGTTTYSVVTRDTTTLDDTITGTTKVPSSYVVGEYVKEAIANKVDKIEGKGLSTNDYTDEDKAEVAKIADKANIRNPLSLSDTDKTKDTVLIQHNYYSDTQTEGYVARSIDVNNLSESGTAMLNIPTSFAVRNYVNNAINSAITTALNTEV